jgi:acetyl-CoA decarbonylase/synthase complex subunit beta
MSMFQDIPVDVGIAYEGERIRRDDMYVEFGGPRIDKKFELLRVKPLEEIEDGKISVVGPDISQLKEGGSYRLGIYVEVAGSQLSEDLEGVFERRIHEYLNYIQGFMHLNQRYDIWCRLSKASYNKGLNSFKYLGLVLIRLFKSEFPIIEKMQVTFITDPDRVAEMWEEAMKVYEARDSRARGLKDEEVDTFYGCILCQSFAPTHVCIITPQRYSNCGAMSWFDCGAAARIDPKGPIFPIPKGELVDPIRGEYTGINEAAKARSLGAIERVYLYTMFGYPHTSCGCFEGVAFYIPEVDGIGIVHRDFKGPTVNGLTFAALADATAGGRQVDGFHGISIEYLRSSKFLQADGGWERVVWMPSAVKERVKGFVPNELLDKIATEKDVSNVDELKRWLEEKGHLIVGRWVKAAKPAPAIEAKPEEVRAVEAKPEVPTVSIPSVEAVVPTARPGVSLRITFKDAKIYARKVIVRRVRIGEQG